MRKYPSIGQFRHVVETVTHRATYIGQSAEAEPIYDESKTKPVLTFTGTTKLHGSNGGVSFDLVSGIRTAQSRERVLTLTEDNHGFCAWTQSAAGAADLAHLRAAVHGAIAFAPAASIHVFGEWCGLSINGNTAIGQLPERFVVFAALVTLVDRTETWIDLPLIAPMWHQLKGDAVTGVNLICDFKQWAISVDFNDPGAVLDCLEQLTMEVEAECPVASALGLRGLGEGIVWTCQDPIFGRQVFKTKGMKHKGTKSARLVSIAPEVLESRDAFCAAVLTDSRLEQGFNLIKAVHGKVTLDRIGEFLMWVGMDVMKEESDTMKASGLDRKLAMSGVNSKAKAWVIPRLEKF